MEKCHPWALKPLQHSLSGFQLLVSISRDTAQPLQPWHTSESFPDRPVYCTREQTPRDIPTRDQPSKGPACADPEEI